MYTDEDITVKLLSKKYDSELYYETYDKYLADLPVLMKLGWIKIHNAYAATDYLLFKITVNNPLQIKFRNGSIILFIKGTIRPVCVPYSMTELTEFIISSAEV